MSSFFRPFEATATTFTRPSDTTQYAANDTVANSTTAGSVTPLQFVIPGHLAKVYGARITKSTASVTTATFKLHLYKDSPTVGAGDNAAWSTSSARYIGNVAVDMSTNTFTDTNTASTAVNNTPLIFAVDADGIVFGILQVTGTYTPGNAETFSVSLFGEVCD